MNQLTIKDARNLIADLRLSDEETSGHPILAPDQVETARAYLEQLLLDCTDRLQQHITTLEQHYRARFVAPLPRSWLEDDTPVVGEPATGFRHSAPLAEPLALAVLEGGVARLSAEDLARLLLSPYAIWDLNDLINTLLPDYWLDLMEGKGVELARAHGIDLYEDFEAVVGSPVRPDAERRLAAAGAWREKKSGLLAVEVKPGLWPIEVPEQVRVRIAALGFGDPGKSFTLSLHRRQDTAGQLAAELEIKPAPTHGDVKIPVRFPTGEEREFVLEVPAETRVDATLTREEMRSDPSAPLPVAAFQFSGWDWQTEGDWLRLIFQSV